ncbi:succinate dehydrogenase assembly factor 2 [Nowakowskiella sp. JEL0407]|nr:succinate dehydrogenase assembly factor 2 [Nowakowskiella sp. JEL0407]
MLRIAFFRSLNKSSRFALIPKYNPRYFSSAKDIKDTEPIDFNIDYELPPTKRTYSPTETLETKRARLIYQSRKRGILETDLLLSTFAAKHLGNFTSEEMDEFAALMDENDWSIYYWATNAKVPPEHWKGSKVLELLIEHAKNSEKKILRMPELGESL